MVWHAGATLSLAIAAMLVLYWGVSAELRRSTDDQLRERIHVLRALLAAGGIENGELEWEVESEWEWLEHHQIFLRILDANGRVMLETRHLAPLLPATVLPDLGGPQQYPSGRRLTTAAARSFQVMTAEASGPSQGERYVIQAAFDLGGEGRVLAQFRLLMFVVVGSAVAASLVVGHRIISTGLRPLAEMIETTHHVGGTTLSERISTEGLPPELASLAENFNHMMGRLEESFDRLSRFSSNAAHELRTPLNSLRVQAEVALGRPRSAEEYREVLVSSLEEYASLSRTIERLLFIAQAEQAAIAVRRERISLCVDLREIVDYYEPAVTEKQLKIQLVCADGGLWLDADRELFRRAVGNLVSNALTFTRPGDSVSVEAAQRNGSVRVQVRDTGVGIAPEHLPHVLDRFYRVEKTREKKQGGAGLGLSIVKAVMDLHGGSVEIESGVGSGTSVTLVFPTTIANS